MTFAELLRDQIRIGYTFTEEGDPGVWVLQALVASVLEIENRARHTDPGKLLEEVLATFQVYSRTTSDEYGNGPWPMFIAVAELDKPGALVFMRNVVAFEMEGKRPARWTE